MRTASAEVIQSIEKVLGEFFMTHTKAELYEGAMRRKILLYPVSTFKDIAEDQQLQSRNFWTRIEHPELGHNITYPAGFIKASGSFLPVRNRAPLVGEHNQEIYIHEMGITKEQLLILKQNNVI